MPTTPMAGMAERRYASATRVPREMPCSIAFRMFPMEDSVSASCERSAGLERVTNKIVELDQLGFRKL